MELLRVSLKNLRASDQPRPLVTEDVDKLAKSIQEVGLIQPITVRRAVVMNGIAEQGYQIVAGHHRVAACRTLAWDAIDAILIESAEFLQAELIEIDENLCRSELTAAQRAKSIKRRKEIWEAMHPSKESGTTCPTLETPKTGRGNEQFAASTAEITGEDKRTINRHVARAEALGDDLDKVTGTSLDKGVELDALKAMPAEDRAPLIERAQAGEKVSARDEVKKPKAPVLAPSIRLQMALIQGMERAFESAGVKSVEEFVQAVNQLPPHECDFLAHELSCFARMGAAGRGA
jgi:hypothetical protein